MTLCPMAMAVGCGKCPVFSVCPLKSIIGDYEEKKVPESKGGKPGSSSGKKKNKK